MQNYVIIKSECQIFKIILVLESLRLFYFIKC